MKPHCRYSPIRAVAAFLFFGIWASSGYAQSPDSLVDPGATVTSAQDTLRPRPDRVQVWHLGSFLVSQAALDRVIRVPLESGRVPVSALGSASWNFSTGLISDSRVSAIQSPFGLGHRLLRGDFDDWRLRKGPLPIADWLGESAHGRGQDFGVTLSASPSYYKHFWVDFRRLQMTGGLATEDHFGDRLQAAFWGRDSANRYCYRVQVESQRSQDGESGGIVNSAQLTDTLQWQPNRALVDTRWSQVDRSTRGFRTRMELIQSSSRLGVRLDYSFSESGFAGPSAGVDSIQYQSLDLRLVSNRSFLWSEPGFRGISEIDVLPRIRASWSLGLRTFSARNWQDSAWMDRTGIPAWSPVGTWEWKGRQNDLRLDGDLLGQSIWLRYDRKRAESSWLRVEAQRRWALPWEGDAVNFVQRFNTLVQLPLAVSATAQFSTSDQVLSVEQWDSPDYEWTLRPSWAVLGANWNPKISLSPFWTAEGMVQLRYASTKQLAIAPAFGEVMVSYERRVNTRGSGMTFRLEFRGQAWSGGWLRPVWIAEKGIFGRSEAEDLMPAGGMLHAAVSVQIGEAQIGVLAQNANQGWIPNTLFIAQNYPVTPASLRWFLRWRMFE